MSSLLNTLAWLHDGAALVLQMDLQVRIVLVEGLESELDITTGGLPGCPPACLVRTPFTSTSYERHI
jgi:hypothetical protein